MNLDTLKFDDKGLIPAVVLDAQSGKILTVCSSAVPTRSA